jgi:hypothetical protein
MAGATIDHLVSLILLLGALVLFIGLFNQTIQTAVSYQQDRNVATECSSLLDSILLSPGYPLDSNTTTFWGRTNSTPTIFGLQDPEFTQYELSPFSLMRLNYTQGNPVYYSKTLMYYSNNTVGSEASLLVPFNEVVNYSAVSALLGINGTYGFSLTITPIVTISINQVQANPLNLTVTAIGNGYPLANANLSYCIINVTGQTQYPSYGITSGTSMTNSAGQAFLNLSSINGTQASYAVIVYASLNGLVGVGYQIHNLYSTDYAVPLIGDFNNGSVFLAHSLDVYGGGSSTAIGYNATFILLAQDFTLQQLQLGNTSGSIGAGTYGTILVPTNNTGVPGVLAVAYEANQASSGIVLMPWGVSSLSFPVVFGGNPLAKEWVATDIRQVTVSGVSYQAKLALWSLAGYQVVS